MNLELESQKNNLQEALRSINAGINNYSRHLSREIRDKEERRCELIAAIENVILGIVQEVAEGKSPVFCLKNQKNWCNTKFTTLLELKSQEMKVDFGSRRSRAHFCVLVQTLNVIHRLIITRNTCTRRELYYQHPLFFTNQSVLDAAVRDICSMLDAPAWDLGVTATSKGLIAGPALLFLETGEKVNCNHPGGALIPQNIHQLEKVESSARFLLILEKDATFQKLLDENALERLGPCILITGKGYPDICTRLLVHLLWKHLQVPVFALVDADPHGVEIMCIYRFGSLAMAHQAELAVPAVRWIGIHPTDISRLAIQAQPLVDADVNKLRHLAARPYIRNNPTLRDQVQALLTGGRKAEIEGVARFSSCYLTDAYLPTKILNSDIM